MTGDEQGGPGAAWQMEGHFGPSRGIVRMRETDGTFTIAVRLDFDGRAPVTFAITPDQAAWLGDALPAALAMARSRQEQRDWETSMQNPFAEFDRADHDGEAARARVDRPADDGGGSDPARSSSSASRLEDAPFPQRRGHAWGADEEARLREAFQAGQDVDHMAVRFQRSPRAIRKRLEKMGLVVADP